MPWANNLLFFLLVILQLSRQNEIFSISENVFGVEVTKISLHLQQLIKQRLLNKKDLKLSLQIINANELSSSGQVNSETGEFRVNRPLDRETICPPNSGIQPGTNIPQHLETDCIKNVDILLRYYSPSGFSVNGIPPETISINLAIHDVNDNQPRWPNPKILVKFTESLSSDDGKLQAKTFPCAKDSDFGRNGTISYKLIGTGSELFQLLVNCSNSFDSYSSNGQIFSEIISISPKIKLDRENEDFIHGDIFNLTVIATDNGPNQLSASLPLEIILIDVNDNAPEFHYNQKATDGTLTNLFYPFGQASYYHVEIPEITPINSAILRLNATDRDSGDNGRVRYDFCPCEHSEARQYFDINSETGVITTKKKFDYDQGPQNFNFKVIAADEAIEPYSLTSTTNVGVKLRDVNDESPIIKVNILNSLADGYGNKRIDSTFLEENTPEGELFALIQITDHDKEDQVSCHLGPKDNFTLHKDLTKLTDSDVIEYQLYTGRLDTHAILTGPKISKDNLFDAEVTRKQNISLTCQDQAGNRATQIIVVNLLDVNDNSPQFSQDTYEFIVDENVSAYHNRGIEIGKVYADDKDLGDNGRVEYFLNNVKGNFEINPNTGQIFLHSQLDREIGPSDGRYVFEVIAKDNGTPERLTGSSRVEIKVNDLNDMPPEFSQENYMFDAPEDVVKGTTIGRVVAYDRDVEGHNDSIRYRFARPTEFEQYSQHSNIYQGSRISDSMAQVYFELNDKTGELKVSRSLDRESISTFLFSIIAEDAPLRRNDKRLSAISRITISVTDVNDNSPKFSQPESKRIIKLPVHTLPGKFLINFKATDLDEGENGRIEYRIKPEVIANPMNTNGPLDQNSASLMNMFSIDENSGSLILLNTFTKPASYRVIVEACDNGSPVLCTNSPPLELIFLDKENFKDSDLLLDENAYGDRFDSPWPGYHGRSGDTPRKNFTIILCLCIIFMTIIVAIVLIFCVFKRTSTSNNMTGAGGYPTTLHGSRNKVFWKSFFYNRDNDQIYAGKEMPKSKENIVSYMNPNEQKYAPNGYFNSRRMNTSGHPVYSTKQQAMYNDMTLQKRSFTSHGYADASPVYQSLDRLDTPLAHQDYQRPQTSIPQNMMNTGYFYNPAEAIYQDQIPNVSYYAMTDKIGNSHMNKTSDATISRTISTKTTDSLNEKQKSPLINPDEAADAEISEYTSKMPEHAKGLHKHEIRAYTEGSFV